MEQPLRQPEVRPQEVQPRREQRVEQHQLAVPPQRELYLPEVPQELHLQAVPQELLPVRPLPVALRLEQQVLLA